MVAYTCRYSSGPLIPNSATAIGINYPLEYLRAKARIRGESGEVPGGFSCTPFEIPRGDLK